MILVFASNNVHKLKEIRNLAPDGYEILSLKDAGWSEDLSETGFSLEENALQKARYVFEKFKMNCFADDTGLEVEALNGAPGVYSARYAGDKRNADDNIIKLLDELKNKENRKAQFRTIIAGIISGKEFICEGIVKGEILKREKGNNGFGYDPVFLPEGSNLSFAEMTLDEKNKLSHRARALEMFLHVLENPDMKL
ncbi:MAG: RdgB/HAM1 family non-canonical purine NTP pyrophosphatase [Bacteroidota bacterium]